jgi:hypothetical protein
MSTFQPADIKACFTTNAYKQFHLLHDAPFGLQEQRGKRRRASWSSAHHSSGPGSLWPVPPQKTLPERRRTDARTDTQFVIIYKIMDKTQGNHKSLNILNINTIKNNEDT